MLVLTSATNVELLLLALVLILQERNIFLYHLNLFLVTFTISEDQNNSITTNILNKQEKYRQINDSI